MKKFSDYYIARFNALFPNCDTHKIEQCIAFMSMAIKVKEKDLRHNENRLSKLNTIIANADENLAYVFEDKIYTLKALLEKRSTILELIDIEDDYILLQYFQELLQKKEN